MGTGDKESKIYRVRVELAVLAILVPLVLVLGAVLDRWPQGVQDAAEGKPVVADNVQQQTIALDIDGPGGAVTRMVAVEGGVTVAQVLEAAALQYDLVLKTKDYGEELGIFVEAIGGVANDSRSDRYWYLYVNGQVSPVGASAAKVGPGDTVMWRYEKQHEEN